MRTQKTKPFIYTHKHTYRSYIYVASPVALQWRICLHCWFNLSVGKTPWRRNGRPLQYSCLEIPMDRRAWRARVQRTAQSETQRGSHAIYTHTHTHSNPQFYLPLRVFACWDEKAISSAVLMGFGGLLASPLSSVSWFPCALLISEQKEPVYYLHWGEHLAPLLKAHLLPSVHVQTVVVYSLEHGSPEKQFSWK